MDLIEVRYFWGNEEVIELQIEEDFLQFVTYYCWNKFKWTPLLEISEGIVFVHSETWDEDFISKEGILEWRRKGIDIENDSDSIFYKKLKKYLQLESKVITSH